MNSNFSNIPITEMYDKCHHKTEWDIQGYEPPKTCLFISRDAGLGKDKRKNFTEDLINQTKYTDPGKYSDTLEASEKKYWSIPSCIFGKEKRETLTAKAMKRSKSIPGPGDYFKDDPTKKKKKLQLKLGKFE